MLTPPRFAGLSDLDSLGWPDAEAQRALPRGLPLRFTQVGCPVSTDEH